MIYLGDGVTDVPCMKLVKDKGGTSIAVFEEGKRKKQQAATDLLTEDRVNFVLPANYSEGSRLEETIKALIDRIVAENKVLSLSKSKSSLVKKCKDASYCTALLSQTSKK